MALDEVSNFYVPMLFSRKYLAKLADINRRAGGNALVREVYGCLPESLVGSLRPAHSLPTVGIRELPAFVSQVHALGFEFNYILNATVLDGSEHTSGGRRRIVQFLEKVCDSGVDRFTVAIPFLIRILRAYFPHVKVSASISCEIASTRRGQRYMDMGVDRVVVARDSNRDFNTLRSMARTLPLELLVNSPCLLQCADVYYHGNLSSMESGSLRVHCQKPMEAFPIPILSCQHAKLTNLTEFVSSPWIRPEDVVRYRAIGISHFKLDGRDRDPDYVLDVVESYLQGRFDGNLLYLTHSGPPRAVSDVGTKNPEMYKFVPIALDNSKLDRFIDPFVEEKIVCRGQCITCGYCDQVASRAIVCDEQWRRTFLGGLVRKLNHGE